MSNPELMNHPCPHCGHLNPIPVGTKKYHCGKCVKAVRVPLEKRGEK